ncbi:hypothetical protein QCB44_02720 [Thiomicrorhabdus sp. zzn3]|uniref:hypothetical protein n=1 Tax=Thiomicrorhabdus sp. zzn3 TaxID=3039775 RepID=UPI00243694B0|nr:hypothetical protein [Thiomicrorhabdus sp. zzn3]MDG6777612.1 hypothetical protein [Thiomicrorhabdus sp. zzn3]
MKQLVEELESQVSLSPNKDVLEERGALAYFNLWLGILYFPAIIGLSIDWSLTNDVYNLNFFTASVVISIVALLVIELITWFTDRNILFLKSYVNTEAVDRHLQDKLMDCFQTKNVDFKIAYDFYKERHELKFKQAKYNMSKLFSLELLIAIVSLYMAYQGLNMPESGNNEEVRLKIIEGSVNIILSFFILRISLFLISDIYKFYSGYVRSEAILRFMFNNIK